MSDLQGLIDLTGDESMPRQRRLYTQLRTAILGQRLLAGAVLPASRSLAQELGVARNTVIHAYEQLAAEGYVCTSRHGTVVAAIGARPSVSVMADGPAMGLSRRVSGYRRPCLSCRASLRWRPFPGPPGVACWSRPCVNARRWT